MTPNFILRSLWQPNSPDLNLSTTRSGGFCKTARLQEPDQGRGRAAAVRVTVLVSELLTMQSANSARDCKPALQLMENISNVHFEHYARLLLSHEERQANSLMADGILLLLLFIIY